MYGGVEYVLKDGEKTASVLPPVGVKQGCPWLPLLLSLYFSDVDWVAEGAMTGAVGHGRTTDGDCVSHLLFADDLISAMWTGLQREVRGSVTGTEGHYVSRLLFAENLTLISNCPPQGVCWEETSY